MEKSRMIKPTFNYVLLTKVQQETSQGGIILPEQADMDDTIVQGKILAIGPECEFFKEEQNVLFSFMEAKEMTYDRVKYFLVKEQDILAKV